MWVLLFQHIASKKKKKRSLSSKIRINSFFLRVSPLFQHFFKRRIRCYALSGLSRPKPCKRLKTRMFPSGLGFSPSIVFFASVNSTTSNTDVNGGIKLNLIQEVIGQIQQQHQCCFCAGGVDLLTLTFQSYRYGDNWVVQSDIPHSYNVNPSKVHLKNLNIRIVKRPVDCVSYLKLVMTTYNVCNLSLT